MNEESKFESCCAKCDAISLDSVLDLDEILVSAVEALVWSEWEWSEPSPDSGNELSEWEALDMLMSNESFMSAGRAALVDFIASSFEDVLEYIDKLGSGQFGHDYVLTRNRDGAGFWDRGLGELGDRLTEAVQVYGEVSVWPTDDGVAYGEW